MVSAPHPLAERLIERLQAGPETRILDFGTGSGRNGEALRRAGFDVTAIDDAAVDEPLPESAVGCRAAISTHGLLHGTPAAIAARVDAIADVLADGGVLFATFGSVRDARFGHGERIDDATFAPIEGDERGVPHAFFDRERIGALLETRFEVESLEETGVDRIAGAWAHRDRPLQAAVHWFAIARKR
jgi:SAM-dependent methyltransferase